METIQFTLAAFADESDPSTEGQIRALLRNGLSRIEVRNTDNISCADLTEEQARALRATYDRHGIFAETLGTPIGKYPILADFAPEQDRFLRTVRNAKILGATRLRIFSFFRDPTLSEQEGRKIALERLAWFSEHADGLTLCHENEKGIYGEGWEFCRQISQTIPSVRAVFDPANFVQCGVDTLRAWEELREYTEYLHLKDSREDRTIVPCGEGCGNVEYILSDFIRRGGRFATLEPHLSHFSGRELLEKNTHAVYEELYASKEEAFDAAANTVKKMLTAKGAEVR